MGCICSKGGSSPPGRTKLKKENSNQFITGTDEEVTGLNDGGNEVTTRLISEKSVGPISPLSDIGPKNPTVYEIPAMSQSQKRGSMSVGMASGQVLGQGLGQGQPHMNRLFSVQNGVDVGQVVAGWPSWLSSVAGEAIKGWIPRKADSFEKLDKIGQGTYSSVYRARDLETEKIVALKKVRFVNMDPESVRFMAREILILRRIDHPNVMKLEGLVTSKNSGNLYLVFEYMEHDLAGLSASSSVKFTESQIKCYMQQLLRGLEHCHNRGVLHRDIKGSNLLIDNNGNLKIGDFGLATFFRANQKAPLTSRVVTLWYRPPELLLGATNYGVSVDLWSTGCILAELFNGKPIMPGRTEVEQLHKIFKLCGSPSDEYWKNSKLPHATIFKPQQPYKRCVSETFKDFPKPVLSLLEPLLSFEPEFRGTASSALENQYFTTKPLPCDPSDMPKYPPSKEYDAKLRDEERRRAAGNNGHKKSSKESKAVPAPDANAELQISMQKWQAQSNTKSISENYNIEEIKKKQLCPPKGGPHITSNLGFDSSRFDSELTSQRSYKTKGTASKLSRFSSSVAGFGSTQSDLNKNNNKNNRETSKLNTKYNQINDAESSHHLLSKKDEAGPGPERESTLGFGQKQTRIHYSGPLLSPSSNVEEMLKEHERQIQFAVRKAQFEKNKVRKNGGLDNGQTESLLNYGENME